MSEPITSEEQLTDEAIVKRADGKLVGLLTEDEFAALERCIACGTASAPERHGFVRVKFHG